ncbi:MAG: hypothetical protein DRJ42_08690 [Deltaproteobacteria bacterium]|nr:MAG: hypothetical protein DRJ42_08690 [Deltaproteobacteria bacterium]
MSSKRNDSSYDLERAARFSARLKGRDVDAKVARDAEDAEGDDSSDYVRFSRGGVRFGAPQGTAASAPAAASVPAPAPDSSELVSFDGAVPWSGEMAGSVGWGRMLDWCVEALEAEAAFVVDGRGLTIAASGSLPQADIDETGARLTVAFEQADELAGTLGIALSVSVELDTGWLVGILVPGADDDKFTVGVVLPRALSNDARQKIAAAFTKKALEL